jgi:rare lipoprotein A (peptidoglycan hydrolase)
VKKFWLIISALAILSSCSSPKSGHKKSKTKFSSNNKFQKIPSKFALRLKPTESMQPGIAKSNIRYVLAESKDSEPSFTMSDENGKNPLLDDGLNYSGRFKIGSPYEIFGVSYFPQNYDDYEEVGIASWYGDDFHGKLTANGETYNMDEMTAAHPTLPLPSMVRVTNLRNGRNVIVRVNDRGPFAKNRVIDVSEKAAISLGFKGQGTTEVKVELLRDDTDKLLQKLNLRQSQ